MAFLPLLSTGKNPVLPIIVLLFFFICILIAHPNQGTRNSNRAIPRTDLTTFGVVNVPLDRYLLAAIGGGTHRYPARVSGP